MVKLDLFHGEDEHKRPFMADAVVARAFVEGLTPRALVALLEDLIASGDDVEDRL
jgi:hypothetical protein